MQIECPSCGHSSELPDHLVGEDGKDLTCPSCSAAFTVLPGGWTTQPDSSSSTDGASAADAQAQGRGSPFESQTPSDIQDSPSGSSVGAPSSGGSRSGSDGSSGSGGSPAKGQRAQSRKRLEVEPGEVLAGQFEIEGQIGRGAVATVYAARDTELGEEIALKAIPTFGNTEAAKRAVLPEYKAVRRLKSGREHILHIDRPTTSVHAGMDLVLLPMERAEQSFRDWLEATADDPGVEERLEEGLALLRQACRGVEALHAEGLAHMDLKPENLLLTRDEGSSEETEWTVKIADFGLARSMRRGEVLNEEVVAEGVGTPYYMAPEQIRAARQKEVRKEADIYSLGVMLFELIDGDRPFDGPADRVREKHREMDPPEVHTEVPKELEDLATQCLSKEPDERPVIGDLIDRIEYQTKAGVHVAKAPIEGTFYRAPSPDVDPFVKVGDSVEEGDVFCIIEAMKLMNEIECETSGTIKEILVEDAEQVEFDQPLFVLDEG